MPNIICRYFQNKWYFLHLILTFWFIKCDRDTNMNISPEHGKCFWKIGLLLNILKNLSLLPSYRLYWHHTSVTEQYFVPDWIRWMTESWDNVGVSCSSCDDDSLTDRHADDAGDEGDAPTLFQHVYLWDKKIKGNSQILDIMIVLGKGVYHLYMEAWSNPGRNGSKDTFNSFWFISPCVSDVGHWYLSCCMSLRLNALHDIHVNICVINRVQSLSHPGTVVKQSAYVYNIYVISFSSITRCTCDFMHP